MAGGHHLILGKLTDVVTGQSLDDTLDERYRQGLARLLLDEKGYTRSDLLPRQPLFVSVDICRAKIPLDFQVRISSIVGMIIKFGPGSIVTRRRPALAMSRICAPYQVPVVVVTNGETAEVMDGATGKEIRPGFDAIPTRDELEKIVSAASLTPIDPKRFEMESRIVYAFEVDGACPCDDTVCRL
jgi:hypothetical protein